MIFKKFKFTAHNWASIKCNREISFKTSSVDAILIVSRTLINAWKRNILRNEFSSIFLICMPASIWVAGSISIFDFTVSFPMYHWWTCWQNWCNIATNLQNFIELNKSLETFFIIHAICEWNTFLRA